MNSSAHESAAIADRFLSARRAATGLVGYPGRFPVTLEQAYGIQTIAMASWGKRVVGWKVGRVMSPHAEQFGADRLAGPIFADQLVPSGEREPAMPVFAEGFAAAEAEFLLHVGVAPPATQTHFSLADAADLIDRVHVGIEIASSPLGSINALGPLAVISDFGNNNGLVIGPEIPDWRSSGFEEWEVHTAIDGATVGTGRASSFPDGAIGAARFLFELLARRGIALEPGQWISSGAVTGVHDGVPGQHVEARFGAELSVSCRLRAALPG